VNPFDTSESLYLRVRGYLAANCAQCHRPGGARPSRDFRWETTLGDTAICDAGAPFGAEIEPGDAGASLLPQKMKGTGIGARMPPLATDVVDTAAVAVVEEWIGSLTACQ
jgi:mono/diheme cytochrome c family protein